MKSFSIITLITSVLILSASCEKQEGSGDNPDTLSQIEQSVLENNWVISKYLDSGKDETSDFSAYHFEFASDGTVQAINQDSQISGTWSLGDDSYDDNPSHLHLYLQFSASSVLEELNDDWEIINWSASRIELRDVSGGNGDVDFLTLDIR